MSEIKILRSKLLSRYPDVLFGFSTKPGGVSPEPYCLNLSNSVGDNSENVIINRNLFFKNLGIDESEVTFQKQIHSSIINYSSKPSHLDGCDAVYTNVKRNFLAISVADCIPVFLYDPLNRIIAGIHSGRIGTKEKIVAKTITEIKKKFNTDPSKLIAYIGPGICQDHYEVGEDAGKIFDENVRYISGDKYYLDLKKDNYNQLIISEVKKENIEISDLCTFEEKELLHSYRRDGTESGRMFGVIGMV